MNTLSNDIINETHLLIAGTTGSGKSVLLHNILIGILNNKPESKFIMIDIKRVELYNFKSIQNTISYNDNEKSIIEAFKNAVSIIEKRFQYMQRKRIRKHNGNDIYIVIDELADILTSKEIYKRSYPDLCRILQIGRAAGVHVIACTQEPTKKFLGRIKSNFTGIIGLRTANINESRNIINESGLELFPKYGHAIYLKDGYKNHFTFNYIEPEEEEKTLQAYKKKSLLDLFRKAH